MSAVLFFRLALLLPLAAPFLLSLFGERRLSNLLMTSLKFGGVQYVLFAIILYYYVGRLKEPDRIRRLSYWAPVLFIPVQAAPVPLFALLSNDGSPDSSGWAFLGALMFVPFVLIIGYGYVLLVNFMYAMYSRLFRPQYS